MNWPPPVIPSEIPGSGYHEPDIGPLQDKPITYAQWKFQRDFHEHVGKGMVRMYDDILKGLSRESPLSAMLNAGDL